MVINLAKANPEILGLNLGDKLWDPTIIWNRKNCLDVDKMKSFVKPDEDFDQMNGKGWFM